MSVVVINYGEVIIVIMFCGLWNIDVKICFVSIILFVLNNLDILMRLIIFGL